ncbi:MAG: DUF1924 domain-containing protein [Zoogloeaceae bacterium]|nr:DUF1924 domain-containing protein [Zoogloeaceae bacterium]
MGSLKGTVLVGLIVWALMGWAAGEPEGQLQGWARAMGMSVSAFSAARGEALYRQENGNAQGGAIGCFSCHTKDPRQPGRTRAGKTIEPMASAVTPTRFTDPAKTEKWFSRNCQDVLGRACTPEEKGDFVTWLTRVKP